MQPVRLGMAGKTGAMQKEELNRSPGDIPVVAKATQRDGHVAGPNCEQPGETPVVL